MQIKHIRGRLFEDEFNKALRVIEDNGDIVVDIKYSSAGKPQNQFDYSAIIIYVSKSKYRELVINKILANVK